MSPPSLVATMSLLSGRMSSRGCMRSHIGDYPSNDLIERKVENIEQNHYKNDDFIVDFQVDG
jgi:hypothetical protein